MSLLSCKHDRATSKFALHGLGSVVATKSHQLCISAFFPGMSITNAWQNVLY